MNHLPVFAGINGFGLAAEWMGWKQIAHCEIDEFCQRVIQFYWPKSIPHYDIKKTDFTPYRGTVDVLSGGFPCQPYSSAGKRLGKEDDRHLWPEMLRAVRESKPRYVVGENVRGLINWSGGLVFEEVQSDLENEGYEVQPFLLPACATGAPHRRDRIWFVSRLISDSGSDGLQWNQESEKGCNCQRCGFPLDESHTLCKCWAASNANPSGLSKRIQREFGGIPKEDGTLQGSELARAFAKADWEKFPTQSPLCIGNDGISSELDGITFLEWRKESIKAYGNAIVPQVAYQIFKAIAECSTK